MANLSDTSAAASAQLRYPGKVPVFYLPSATGGQSGPAATRSKYNLVLLFVEGGEQTSNYLQALAVIHRNILAEAARVMAVVALPLDEVRTLSERLRVPFTLLADEDGKTTTRMLGESAHAALCIADRYGVIYYLEAVPSTSDLPDVQAVLDWLEFVQIQCPE
jgi:peroxiredoxin